jgi:hypothetical protein
MGVFEFKPSDSLHMVAGRLPLGLQRGANHPAHGIRHLPGKTSPRSRTLARSENGASSRAPFENVPFMVIENYNNDRDASVDSIGLNTQYAFNDDWSMRSD